VTLVFLGTPDFAVPSLIRLHEAGHEILAVLTRPDRPAGRGQKVRASAVKREALFRGLHIHQPVRLDANVLETLHGVGPEAVVVVAYGLILPPTLLHLPPLGCINLHASLLPRYRGAAPIIHAILRGETRTGVTSLMMDEGIDTGPILLQRECPIGPEETAGDLEARLAPLGAALLVETLDSLSRGDLTPQTQNVDRGTYAPRVGPETARIVWRQQSPIVYNLVRAMNPRPGASAMMGDRWMKVWRAAIGPPALGGDREMNPGTVIIEAGLPKVICGQGTTLLLREIQFESRIRVSGEEAASGRWLLRGDRFDEPPNAAREGTGPTTALL